MNDEHTFYGAGQMAAMGGLSNACAAKQEPRTIAQLLKEEEDRLHSRLGEIEKMRCTLTTGVLNATDADLNRLSRIVSRIHF